MQFVKSLPSIFRIGVPSGSKPSAVEAAGGRRAAGDEAPLVEGDARRRRVPGTATDRGPQQTYVTWNDTDVSLLECSLMLCS